MRLEKFEESRGDGFQEHLDTGHLERHLSLSQGAVRSDTLPDGRGLLQGQPEDFCQRGALHQLRQGDCDDL